MKKRYVYFLLTILFFIVFNVSEVYGFTFFRSLKVGDQGIDVLELQKILNSNFETRISTTGLGSPGQETQYFGNLTRLAVIKYQNKYAIDVLAPAGLSVGTGFVGPLTIKKLNTIAISSQPAQSTIKSADPLIIKPQSQTQSQPSATSQNIQMGLSEGEMVVYSAMPREVRPGENIVVYGRGFPVSGTGVKLGGTTLKDIIRISDTELSVLIPKDFSQSEYTLSFSHPSKPIVNPPHKIPIIVTNNPRKAPKIISVFPQMINENDTVTITGAGFSKNNTIYSLMGEIKNISSSDGTTLTFKPADFSQIAQLKIIREKIGVNSTKGIYLPLGVVNEGGFTLDKVYLIINK
ncbi:MAG: peptidoglycan-binding protein [bacterium]|nr:peptidoglycan-binding protein [bacterium]